MSSHSQFLSSYQENLRQFAPSVADEILNHSRIRPELISPFQVTLPQTLFSEIKEFARAFQQVIHSEAYQSELPTKRPWQSWPRTPSVLSCYDFHYNPETGLKLIEVNTNASLYLVSHILYRTHNIPAPDPQLAKLQKSFESALSLKANSQISITDTQPEKEGLYFEFLLYRHWLETLGYQAEIRALKDLDFEHTSAIYNRSTDFFLDENPQLLEAYLSNQIKLSPNPWGYFSMADKQRLSLIRKHLPENLQKVIPQSRLFREFADKEEIWAERKKLFFKPSQSYGSKAVFSGKGISRRAFDNIYRGDFLAQELCPPGQLEFEYEQTTHKMKFDLRLFFYEGEIQSYLARLYQGQATNMRTHLGGIAPILWAEM